MNGDERYPRLIAQQADEGSREMLRAVARGRGVLVVLLVTPPTRGGRHILEANAPGGTPELFFADAIAPPCAAGFPLKLEPYVGPQTSPPATDPRLALDVPPSSRSGGFDAVLEVPDLALDSLPPRRSDSPARPVDSLPVEPMMAPDEGGWLLTGSGGMQSALGSADREVDNAWLGELSMTADVAQFKEETTAFATAVGKLLQRGDAAAISAVITTMRQIMKKDNGAGRAKYAGRVLRVLRDPAALAPFVDEALAGAAEPSPALQHMLLETQAAAAEALCGGRLRHVSIASRMRFVALMRAVGPAAMVSIAATLRVCLARGERGGDLIEDLLRAIPPTVADEGTAMAVAELLRGGPVPTTTGAALAALPGLWGDRARPLVLAGLGHPDANVVVVAINGLRALRAIDATVVRRLEPIVSGITPATEEMCVAACAALAEALPEARMDAVVAASRGFGADRGASPGVSVALARTALVLGVQNAAALIQERAASTGEPLRGWLMSLLHRS